MSQHFLWISYARMKQDFWKAIQTVKYTWNSAAEASTMKLNNLITVYWSEGSYFIIRFWFQASIMKGTQKVSGAGSSKLLWWFQRAQLLNSTKLYCQIQFFRVNLVTTKIVQETKCHIEWFFKNSRLRIYVNQNYLAIFMKMIQITFPLTIRKKSPKRNQK